MRWQKIRLPLRWLITTAFAVAFFLIGSRALIRGPEAEAPAPEPPKAWPAAWAIPAEPDSRPLQSAAREEKRTDAAVIPAPLPLPPLARDGNGRVITGRGFVRAVYMACPPESVFG